MILRNATIWGRPGRFALVAEAGMICWIGADALAPSPLPEDIVLDLGGDLVLPGFCDSHLHLFAGGVALSELNLADIHATPDLARALTDWARPLPPGAMLCAYGANYDLMGQGRRPDRHALDAIFANRPVFIAATDFHCAWANTRALLAAGILGGTAMVDGVIIGPDGQATGELREFAAMDLVKRIGPDGGRAGLGLTGSEPDGVTPDQRTRDAATLIAAMNACAAQGITAVSNMDGNLYQAGLLQDIAARGEMALHVNLPMTLVPGMSDARRAALYEQAACAPAGLLSFGSVKMFMDGVFDTWTAFRTDDYPGRPGDKGKPLFSPSEFARNCIEADARGLQIATHAVGDGAVRAVLDGYAAARAANGVRDSRHRIEHIDMLHRDDLARIRSLGIVASMQPVHPPGSAGLPLEPTISIMGAHRWRDTFPWRVLRDAGVPVAFGTDWPVSPLSPMNALHAALSRQPWAKGGPDQRLSLAECVDAYTAAGAYTRFAEGARGRIAVGQAADIVVLYGDPSGLAHDPAACAVRLTLVGGRVVYQA